MTAPRTLKKLRRRGRNTARGWLAQAVKTYAKALESTEPSSSREELFAQVLQFTEQILESLKTSPRSKEPIHELLDDTLALLAKELGLESGEYVQAIKKRQDHPQQLNPTLNDGADNFKGLTPLSRLSQLPPLSRCPNLVREVDGNLSHETVLALRDFHPEIVLYSPQIPPNTGTIARLCAAFSCRLHLIEPLGFDVSEKSFRRAGLDYWPFVELYVHSSWEEFLATRPSRRIILVETGGKQTPSEFNFEPGDLLVFGAETSGIPVNILAECRESQRGHLVTIAMFDRGVRSLNLANSVSIVAHCALSNIHSRSVSSQS